MLDRGVCRPLLLPVGYIGIYSVVQLKHSGLHLLKNPLRMLFSSKWQTACCDAGLGNREKREDGKLKYVGPIPHDFRRTAIRNMVRVGNHERVVIAISGHKTRSVFDRYNIVSEDDLREAARRSSEHMQRQSKASSVVHPIKNKG